MSGLLQRHGTKLYELKPINVLQAAEADLNLRARKDDADDETLLQAALEIAS